MCCNPVLPSISSTVYSIVELRYLIRTGNPGVCMAIPVSSWPSRLGKKRKKSDAGTSCLPCCTLAGPVRRWLYGLVACFIGSASNQLFADFISRVTVPSLSLSLSLSLSVPALSPGPPGEDESQGQGRQGRASTSSIFRAFSSIPGPPTHRPQTTVNVVRAWLSLWGVAPSLSAPPSLYRRRRGHRRSSPPGPGHTNVAHFTRSCPYPPLLPTSKTHAFSHVSTVWAFPPATLLFKSSPSFNSTDRLRWQSPPPPPPTSPPSRTVVETNSTKT
ncbi:hypothetical protein LX32DRAFT_42356 [Colletotrichum zoysiae]|uniref:Uncharacterized protein n=1 Tax=Colletotrichum zoysiae TaxID=1216348 RepID=A0AAD9HSM3_9PEZI|nr:hypothetical protein LX32DRAFT_42356 [Colletotrichum zoysiae]